MKTILPEMRRSATRSHAATGSGAARVLASWVVTGHLQVPELRFVAGQR